MVINYFWTVDLFYVNWVFRTFLCFCLIMASIPFCIVIFWVDIIKTLMWCYSLQPYYLVMEILADLVAVVNLGLHGSLCENLTWLQHGRRQEYQASRLVAESCELWAGECHEHVLRTNDKGCVGWCHSWVIGSTSEWRWPYMLASLNFYCVMTGCCDGWNFED